MPDPLETGLFLSTAHQCAMELMTNALYIRREAPTVVFPPGIGESVSDICDRLVETKFDVVSAIHEIAEILDGEADESRICARSESICRWLDEAILGMHRLVIELQNASERDEQYRLGYFLLAESAVNILNARNAIPSPAATSK